MLKPNPAPKDTDLNEQSHAYRAPYHASDRPGKTSKEIGNELSIHYRTVENHRTNMCRKLELEGEGANALLRYALQNKNFFKTPESPVVLPRVDHTGRRVATSISIPQELSYSCPIEADTQNVSSLFVTVTK